MTDIAHHPSPATTGPAPRPALRSVAVPTEHGGWGLTAEPVALGLAIAPSLAGVCLGGAALLAFMARTPLRVVLVDRHRHRDLARTALARRVLAGEVALIVALIAVAAVTAGHAFWWPAAAAAPLVAVELWFDARSRSRRLVPELAGSIGIGSVAAMIILAAGHPGREAIAVWLILAARAITSIPHVRALIDRLHDRATDGRIPLAADVVALLTAAAAAAVEPTVAPGAVTVGIVVVVQRLTAPSPVPATVVGIRQTALGVAVVAATAIGVHLA